MRKAIGITLFVIIVAVVIIMLFVLPNTEREVISVVWAYTVGLMCGSGVAFAIEMLFGGKE